MTRVGPQYGSNYREQDDAYVAKHPPKIVWRRKQNGVYVAVSVQETDRPLKRSRQPREYNTTRCRNNHEYTEENTYVSSEGVRQCRACAAAWQRKRRLAAKTLGTESTLRDAAGSEL
jgi:hypothetical protein